MHRHLWLQLTRRNLAQRYRGSILGRLWSVAQPAFMLAIYTFVFSVVFQARWDTPTQGGLGFALVLFLGISVHGLLAESLIGSPHVLVSQPNFLKKVIFPVEVLPLVLVGTSIVSVAIQVGLLLGLHALSTQSLSASTLSLPLLFLPLVFAAMGFAWLLAGLAVFVRDVGHLTPMVSTVLLFLSPIFYPASRLPEPYSKLIYLSPLTWTLEAARAAVFAGVWPSPSFLCVSLLLGYAVALTGLCFFRTFRGDYADVL